MKTKYAIVINEKGYKIEFVVVRIGDTENGVQGMPLYYMLGEDESLIFEDVIVALSMLKPRWNGKSWEETATEEEISAARPKPIEQPPTETELLAAELSLALAQQQSQMEMAIAELSMAIATR